MQTALGVALSTALVSFVLVSFRKKLKPYASPVVFAVLSVLALSAYAGLGNITERYALAASAFLAVSVGLLIEIVIGARRTVGVVLIGAVILSGYVNYRSLKDAEIHWKTASQVSAHTVLSMKNSFFPLLSNTEFVFVDVPIRYGRAWIFPTGLDDAMWHIFKFNPYWYRIFTVRPSKRRWIIRGAGRVLRGMSSFFDDKLILNRVIIEIERWNRIHEIRGIPEGKVFDSSCTGGADCDSTVYKISGPVADWHSWRQSDTAAVARELSQVRFRSAETQGMTTCQTYRPALIIRKDFASSNSLPTRSYQQRYIPRFPRCHLKSGCAL
jgi:hypothetical protein